MAKPILIVKLPLSDEYSRSELDTIGKGLGERLKDYYVITLQCEMESKEPTFQAIFEKDIAEEEVGALQKMVLDSIENINPKV